MLVQLPKKDAGAGIAFGGGTTANGALNELFVTVGPGIGTSELAGTFAKIIFKP